jgi:hypothetical protein
MKQTAIEFLISKIESNSNPFITQEKLKERIEQAKEMEKQQMCEFAEYVATYPDKNRNVNGDMLHAKSKYDGAERTIDLLEQYYNETFKK